MQVDWLGGLRSSLSLGPRRQKRHGQRQLSVRQAKFEVLEDRRMLAVFTVDNWADSGVGSLRSAIASANGSAGADTIIFNTAVFNSAHTIELSSGELLITDGLTITGPGRDFLTIDAQQNSRIINIDDTTTSSETFDVTFTGMTLTGGRTTADGSQGQGGGIRTVTSGTLTITNSTVTGNNTEGNNINLFQPVFVADGGGIFALGLVTLTDSILSNNHTNGLGARGGGIFSSGEVLLTNSTISGNSTLGNSLYSLYERSFIVNSDGGGIFAGGAVTLTHSTLTDNSTTGLVAKGGGIYAGGDVTIDNSSIVENSTLGSGWFQGNRKVNTADGGAVFSGGTISIYQSSLSGNSTLGRGGGLFGSGTVLLEDTIISDNSSGRAGGGIFGKGSVTLTGQSIVSWNYTFGDDIYSGAFSGGEAGVFNAHGGGIFSLGLVSLTESTVSGNSTQGTGANGGGINAANVSLIESTVLYNSTLNTDSSYASAGGGIIAGTVTLTQSAVGGNSSSSHGGGIVAGTVTLMKSAVTGNTSAKRGGGIYTGFNSGSVTLFESTVSGNLTTSFDAGGGGIFAGTVNLTDSTVSGNSTASGMSYGGGVHARIGVTLTRSTVSGNIALSNQDSNNSFGGGIYSPGAVTITQSTITNNHVFGINSHGGGVWNRIGSIVIEGSIVAGNTSGGTAPDLEAGNGTPTIDHSLIGVADGLTITGGGSNKTGTAAAPLNPLLGPLSYNGGLTKTHALLPGSQAINSGDAAIIYNPTEFDQRGLPFLRVFSGRIDMGAYEAQFTTMFDFGDAPDTATGNGPGNYNTLSADNGPQHRLVTGLKMGANIDGESGTLQNAAANADDVNGALPDDEDGLANPVSDLILTVGAQPTVNVRVTNTTGTAATLYGWIDFDANGVFDNSTEHSSIIVPNGTNNGIVTLTLPTVPTGYTGTTYARFRLSTDAAASNSTGLASDGEVEDYRVSIHLPSDGRPDDSKTIKIADLTSGGPALSNNDLFGVSVASLGDLDGDGVTDIAVGAHFDDTNGPDRGAVHILFLNPDGTVKSSQKIGSGVSGGPVIPGADRFGRSVAAIGDLDGDGIVDLAVGADLDDTNGLNRGSVYVLFLNSNGTVKSSQKIASGFGGGPALGNNDLFGVSVGSIGDLDGDGVADLAVGAQFDDTGGTDRGAVHILFLNSNGTVKGSQKFASGINAGPLLANGDRFGVAVVSLGDIDGDGITDLAVGAFTDDTGGSEKGATYVMFMNADGTAKSSQKIAQGIGGGPTLADGDHFGRSIVALGDLDGDGVKDLGVGANYDDTGGDRRGSFYVLFLNSDGTVKRDHKIANQTGGGPSLSNSDRFGVSLASLGDLDGDGLIDLAVGSEYDDTGGTERGAVYVLFLKNVNTAPNFTSLTTASVAENSAAVMTVSAMDSDVPAQSLTFSLVGGADQSKFSITSGGVLSFVAAPDFEAPTDFGEDNIYEVMVNVDDGEGGTKTQTIDVTVTPQNDNVPVITTQNSVSTEENSTAVMTVMATDADLPSQNLSFSIVGGADQSKFSITSDGILTFGLAPDFEVPTDSNGDNIYVVVVQASDGSLAAVDAILVSVTNVLELSADFDEDGDIDGRDFLAWQRGLGIQVPNAVLADGDADEDKDVDANDLSVWQSQYGTVPLSAGASLEWRVEGIGTEELLAVSGQQLAEREKSGSEILSYGGENPTRSGELQTANPTRRVGQLSLVDLALAKEWMGRVVDKSETLFVEDRILSEAAIDAAHGSNGLVPVATRHAGLKLLAEESEEIEVAWLSDELLELVFGEL